MQKINYPLIVSDFDGTLVNKDGTISEKNQQAIAAYIQAGGIFAISTGRMPKGILSRAQELGLQGMVCCCQGAIIMDIESGKPILEGKISFESTLAACKKMEELGLHIHIYDFWDFYCNMDDDALKLYEYATRSKGQCVLDKSLSQFIEENKFCTYKLLAMVEEKDNAAIFDMLEKAAFEGCEVTKSGTNLVEVINKNYSKGTAVEFLANHYGIPLEKTIGIGDQWNDLPMIQKAGLGVAVNNADQRLKDQADYVCEHTNETGAIWEVIQKFGFQEN
ncbi:MAG: HAD family hydrolase [Clostridia bacterium]|nr:HAD family hydrolase [Clostridia bacterium]